MEFEEWAGLMERKSVGHGPFLSFMQRPSMLLVPDIGNSVFGLSGGHGQSRNKMDVGKGECMIARPYA